MGGYSLSPSKLNAFMKCGFCFYLMMHKYDKRSSDEGVAGITRDFDRETKEYFDNYRRKGTLPQEIDVKGARLFSDETQLNVWRNISRGIEWHDEAGNRLRGAIDDLLVTAEGTFAVIDYKTCGDDPIDKLVERYRLQLDTYNLLFRKNGYPAADHSYLLLERVGKRSKRGMRLSSTLVKVDSNPNWAEQVYNSAVELLDNPLPLLNPNCGRCQRVMNVSNLVWTRFVCQMQLMMSLWQRPLQ